MVSEYLVTFDITLITEHGFRSGLDMQLRVPAHAGDKDVAIARAACQVYKSVRSEFSVNSVKAEIDG